MVKMKYISAFNQEERIIKVHDDVADKILKTQSEGLESAQIYQFKAMTGQKTHKGDNEWIRMIACNGQKEFEIIPDNSVVSEDLKQWIDQVNLNGIEVEYLPLAVTGLSRDFQYRFSAPVQFALLMNVIKITHNLNFTTEDFDTRLRKELINAFIEMAEDNGVFGLKQSMPCKLVEMELVRK